MIADLELILNADGSTYHLNLLPEDLASTIIFVGSPDRVGEVSCYFDHIEVKKGKHEFITHTGLLRGKRISVISSGIGTDNIDIVFNEIDTLVNVDFATRTLKEQLTSLDIIRIGTSGSIQGDIQMGTILVSEYAIGFDALMQYYVKNYSEAEKYIQHAVMEQFSPLEFPPYVGRASKRLLARIAPELRKGITITAPSSYGSQRLTMRSSNMCSDLVQKANAFLLDDKTISNFEMETAGIYALANMLGHHALSINVILANQVHDTFVDDPKKIINEAIKYVLARI